MCNIAACAREPAKSCAASLWSKPIETLIACISSAGFFSNRPPHRLCPSGFWPFWCEASSDMSEIEPLEKQTPAKPASLGRGTTTAIAGFLGVGAIAALYVMGLAACKPSPDAGVATVAHGTMAKLKPPAAPATYPDASFVDGAGKSVKLADFKGQAVVLNLWATWCAPCVKEMPTLAALQTAYAGKGLKVVALSADSATATDKGQGLHRRPSAADVLSGCVERSTDVAEPADRGLSHHPAL